MSGQVFERVFIIILENKLASQVLEDPYMGTTLKEQGTYLSNSYGVTHPSQPNYIAATAGDTCGVWDNVTQNVDATNIVDLLEGNGVSWKAYIEGLPDDKLVTRSRAYVRKHNPFVSFLNIQTNADRLAQVVNAKELQTDVDNNTLPQYCWYTPNEFNDGHNTTIAYMSNWLQGFLTPLLGNPNFTDGTLTVITFDESIPYSDNHVYTLLLGDMVEAGIEQDAKYDHFSLLRTIEMNWDLGDLGRYDRHSNYYEFLWAPEQRRAFDPSIHGLTDESPGTSRST